MNGIADEIKALSAEIAGYIADIRRHIHRCPETSWQEFHSTEPVRRELARRWIFRAAYNPFHKKPAPGHG